MNKIYLLFIFNLFLFSCSGFSNNNYIEKYTLLELRVLTSLTGLEKNQLNSNYFGDTTTVKFIIMPINVSYKGDNYNTIKIIEDAIQRIKKASLGVVSFTFNSGVGKNKKGIIIKEGSFINKYKYGQYKLFANNNGNISVCMIDLAKVHISVVLNEMLNCLGIEDNIWLYDNDVLYDNGSFLGNTNISLATSQIIRFHYLCVHSGATWQQVYKLIYSYCGKKIFKKY